MLDIIRDFKDFSNVFDENERKFEEKTTWVDRYQRHLTTSELAELDALPENQYLVEKDKEFEAALAEFDQCIKGLPKIEPNLAIQDTYAQKDKILANNLKAFCKNVSLNAAINQLIRNLRQAKESEVSAEAIYKHLPETMIGYTERNQGKKIKLKLPEWRYLPQTSQNAFYQLVMSNIDAQGEYKLVPFTFVLSDELHQKCLSSKDGYATYLQNRLSVSLSRSIGRVPHFWFSLEFERPKEWMPKAGSGTHPHIHGSILLKTGELKNSRQAFHRVNGSADKSNHDLMFSIRTRLACIKNRGRAACDMNWPLYVGKMEGRMKRLSGVENICSISCSKELSKEAKIFYENLLSMLD